MVVGNELIPKEDSNCCLVSTKYSKIHCKHICQCVCGMICNNMFSRESHFQQGLAAALGVAAAQPRAVLAPLPTGTSKPGQVGWLGKPHCSLPRGTARALNQQKLRVGYMNHSYTGVG